MWHSVFPVLPVHPFLIWTETTLESIVDSLEETIISLRWLEPWLSQDHGIYLQHSQGSPKFIHSNSILGYFAQPSNREVLTAPLLTTFSQFIWMRFVFRCWFFPWSIEYRLLVPVTRLVIGPHGAYGANGSRRHRSGESRGMAGGAREGRRSVRYPSAAVTSPNPCFNRDANCTCVLVSIQGRCCFKPLVRPINRTARPALSAGLVIRAVSPRANRIQMCGHDSLCPIHFSIAKCDLFLSVTDTI